MCLSSDSRHRTKWKAYLQPAGHVSDADTAPVAMGDSDHLMTQRQEALRQLEHVSLHAATVWVEEVGHHAGRTGCMRGVMIRAAVPAYSITYEYVTKRTDTQHWLRIRTVAQYSSIYNNNSS